MAHPQSNSMDVRFLVSGDTALVVEFGDRIDRALNDRVLRLSSALRVSGVPGLIETVPTYRSLMVLYDPSATDYETLTAHIRALLEHDERVPSVAKLWRIPACYEASHAPDLAEVAERTKLEPDEVVRLHSQTRFHVYMIGFVPGFPYMGDLTQSLVLPRRVDPRVKVPAGSIAIATNMTAIYPIESPGGWHLIGSTPLTLFDATLERPALLAPGDEVCFDPITSGEFDAISARISKGTYRVPCEPLQ